MFYEEQKINGVWMWRSTPDGYWQHFTDYMCRLMMRKDLLAMAERILGPTIPFREFNSELELFWFWCECRAFADELKTRS